MRRCLFRGSMTGSGFSLQCSPGAWWNFSGAWSSSDMEPHAAPVDKSFRYSVPCLALVPLSGSSALVWLQWPFITLYCSIFEANICRAVSTYLKNINIFEECRTIEIYFEKDIAKLGSRHQCECISQKNCQKVESWPLVGQSGTLSWRRKKYLRLKHRKNCESCPT